MHIAYSPKSTKSEEVENRIIAKQENSFDGPKTVQNTASIFRDGDRICVRGTWISNKAGIVVIKLTVSYNGVILGQHDFLVGWMAINSANITNPAPVSENPGAQPGNSANVQVTGSIPLNQEFQTDWGLPSQLIMPNDWATWANAMATTDQNLSSLPASAYWDIHDSSGPLANESPNGSPDVHVSLAQCPGSVLDPFVDQVDNCTGNGEDFSRIFGDLTNGETGPFDPSYASTLLSDGRLNSSDAPMPALKIVFNSTGGMGGFDNSCLNDKDNVYNSNFGTNLVPEPSDDDGFGSLSCIKGTSTADDQEVTPHSLYAPYYDQYIPATSRDPGGAASGIDGPVYTDSTGQPNNFQGFGWYGSYSNWKIAQTLVQGKSQPTDCLLTTRDRDVINRQTNDFATKIIEFTDEHGEARAQWQPGVNNDNFGTTVGFVGPERRLRPPGRRPRRSDDLSGRSLPVPAHRSRYSGDRNDHEAHQQPVREDALVRPQEQRVQRCRVHLHGDRPGHRGQRRRLQR